MTYEDAFGMKVTYGNGEARDANGVVDVTHFGAVKQIQQVIDFDKDGVPSTSDLTIRSSKIPAGSAVLNARLVVLKAAATAATTVDVGAVKLNGTATTQDPNGDGLLDGVALSAGVKDPVASEALIGKVVTEDSYISVAPSASTAAALGGLYAVLIVEYV